MHGLAVGLVVDAVQHQAALQRGWLLAAGRRGVDPSRAGCCASADGRGGRLGGMVQHGM